VQKFAKLSIIQPGLLDFTQISYILLSRDWRLEGKCMLKGRRSISGISGSSEFGHLSTFTGCGSDIQHKSATVLTAVTSHTNIFPERHGIRVISSGRLPSRRVRLTGFAVPALAWCTKL